MVVVFGKGAQQKLLDLNYFLIRAGAIRCKMLNTWALMGVVCGEKGTVLTILSEQRRQRTCNIGHRIQQIRHFIFHHK